MPWQDLPPNQSFSLADGHMVVRAVVPYAAGDQAFISYGPLPNCALLMTHGFTAVCGRVIMEWDREARGSGGGVCSVM
jgi:hypothetical protein